MKKKIKKSSVLLFALLIILIIILFCSLFKKTTGGQKTTKTISDKTTEIKTHYNKYVKTNKEAIIYDNSNNEIGLIGKNVELVLLEQEIDNNTIYFNIDEFDNKYYINYEDVNPIEKLSDIDDRYKKYIVFNENVITNSITRLYDRQDNLIYQINESFDMPIIIKDDEKYGVEFNNRLLYVKKNDISEVKYSYNTDAKNSSGVGVLNYHAFYDDEDPVAASNCTTEICHSKKQFKSHLDYFKDNNITTLRINELEMYIDGKIQLPKSVLITIDDGGLTEIAVNMLTEYKMYATIFLITGWFDSSTYYTTDYIELHSHSDNLHTQGDCPTGQGGGIQCLPEETIQNDLKLSREKLNGSTYFCYPFYEYNDYSTRMLKEAGFTMAFIGESNYSDNLVHVGSDKYKLRRFVIVTYTTLNDFDKYFGQIK